MLFTFFLETIRTYFLLFKYRIYEYQKQYIYVWHYDLILANHITACQPSVIFIVYLSTTVHTYVRFH